MDARTSRYHDVYARWQRDPQGFWGEAAREIDWIEPPKQVFDPNAGVYGRWFTGGVCNTCWNAVDRHVLRGRGEQAAIIYDSPLAGQKRTISYHRLQVETQVLAAILRNFGVGKGDRVVIYMPMVPEAVIAMLACARIGAVHSVVFGGFAANELATRIDDAKPKLILSASCGLEVGRYKPLLDEAIALAGHKPDACLILQRPQQEAALVPGRDHDWAKLHDEAIVFARSVYDCVPVAATDPLYILYTSGTTGRPKGVVRDNGGHMVALKAPAEFRPGHAPRSAPSIPELFRSSCRSQSCDADGIPRCSIRALRPSAYRPSAAACRPPQPALDRFPLFDLTSATRHVKPTPCRPRRRRQTAIRGAQLRWRPSPARPSANYRAAAATPQPVPAASYR